MALEHYLKLSLTSGIGPRTARRLLDLTGSAAAAARAPVDVFEQIPGLGSNRARHLARELKNGDAAVEEELAKAAAAGVRIICPDDDEYPLLLKIVPDPPVVLYLRGGIEPRDLNSIAIVGARKCSLYGREQAERFAALLAGAAFTVVSGGARGVDSSAHRGAMQHPAGRTIAVLGCGLDVTFPPENGPLFSQIAERGAVVSEFAMGTAPLAENFPRRNRVISGLSRGVLVVECEIRSGAMITARHAADDHNRTVFAVPNRVDNPMCEGPHQLIRDGAIMAANLEDILTGLGPLPMEASEVSLPIASGDAADGELFPPAPAATIGTVEIELTERQQAIFNCVSADPTGVDAIIDQTELPANVVLQELTLLSLKSLVKRVSGQQFVRSKRQ